MAKKNILVVEDQEEVQELLCHNLRREGFQVEAVCNGEDGLLLLLRKKPDLVLLDLMLPGMNGLEVCRRIKADPKTQNVPIIMVTAKAEEADVVAGIEMGADDYVTKPFSVRVLVSRVRAMFRRQTGSDYDREEEVRVHDIEISPSRHRIYVGGEPVDGLTLTEFRLLHLLASRPGWVFTRQQILDAVRGADIMVTERAVDVQLVGLRKKLGPRGDYIEAVRGVGYRFRDAARRRPSRVLADAV